MTAASWFPPPAHPVVAAVAGMHDQLDGVRDAGLATLSAEELGRLLLETTRLRARLVELTGRVAVAADRAGVADRSGATSTATWWAHHTRQTRRAAHRSLRLAASLDTGHEPVRGALAEGQLLPDQARVIIGAVEDLPTDLVDDTTRAQAEVHLLGLARDHDADELRRLGRHLLEVVAPESAEQRLARQLEAEEARARESARLTMRDDGHGRTHGRFTIPTAQAQILCKHLMALAAPRRRRPADAPDEARSLPQRLGQAFIEYVERYPADATPDAGGVAATVVVTMPLASLLGGEAAATLDTGGEISASQARRIACEAGIIPAVLGARSQVLDLGRERRFHSKAQRIALALEQGGCTAEGCDWPPGMCHAHHEVPWHRHGRTDVRTGRLLCPRHHARAHDPAYTTHALPTGRVAFVRRI